MTAAAAQRSRQDSQVPPAGEFGGAAGWPCQGPKPNLGVAQMIPFRIGADTNCTDGACGQLSRIIVNPAARQVTHLAVDPGHRHGSGRLVPADLVDTTSGQIRLRCTRAEFEALPPAQEAESVWGLDPTGSPHAPKQANYFVWMHMARDPGKSEALQQATVHSVPSGEVEVHRDLTVCATDGEIGQVQGLVVEPGGHQVTHVLLQQGHLRGRKEVAIPIDAVAKVGTMIIHLGLTKHQVTDLPPIQI